MIADKIRDNVGVIIRVSAYGRTSTRAQWFEPNAGLWLAYERLTYSINKYREQRNN